MQVQEPAALHPAALLEAPPPPDDEGSQEEAPSLIDLVNFIVGCLASFILGLAAHSIYLHEKERHGWRFPWDHDE